MHAAACCLLPRPHRDQSEVVWVEGRRRYRLCAVAVLLDVPGMDWDAKVSLKQQVLQGVSKHDCIQQVHGRIAGVGWE
jgi:hypothetical protein